MTSLQFSGKPKKPSLLLVRRVVGLSMQPTLRPGQIIVATSLKRPMPGDVVVFEHQGFEKIKRLEKINGSEMFVAGDNPAQSTDSRQFGVLPITVVRAVVVWPRRAKIGL